MGTAVLTVNDQIRAYLLAATGNPTNSTLDIDTLRLQFLANGSFTRDQVSLAKPSDSGFLAMTSDPGYCSGGSIITSGVLSGIRIWLAAGTYNNIYLGCTVVGATLTAAQSFAGIYNQQTGVLLRGTSALDVVFTGLGLNVCPLTSALVITVAGFYDICFYSVGTTMPTFARTSNIDVRIPNLNLAGNFLRAFTADAALTAALPATRVAKVASNQCFWAAAA